VLIGLTAILGVNLTDRASAGGPIVLTFPLECTLGVNCFVQNYVDHDPGAGYKDFHCGAMTYDGHDGTDFRLPSMDFQRKGIAVLAAASGTVLRVRDGVPDELMTSATKANSAGAECGNGVVIDHGDGWETQYCHMAKGSIIAKPNAKVKRGEPVGLIGLSGATMFPHLHLTVRHNGVVVDPMAPDLASDSCSDKAGSILFDSNWQKFEYQNRIVLNYGFVDGPLIMSDIEQGGLSTRQPKKESDALVAYVRVMGIETGDSQVFAVFGPDGESLSSRKFPAIDRPKAQNMLYIGVKRPNDGWKPGVYSALYTIVNNQQTKTSKWFYLQF